MTIFSRYVFRQAFSALLLILLSLTGIVWISLALRELNVVASSGQSALKLVEITTLGLPNFVAIIAPFAFLIAAIHTLNRLNGDSEIIVLTASGATAFTVMRPVLAVGLMVTALVTFINLVGMPWSLRLLRQEIMAMRSDLLGQVIQPGRFSSPDQGLTFHIRQRTPDGQLLGLLVHDTRNPAQIQSYLSERGAVVNQNGTAFLTMENGHILRSNGFRQPTQIISFSTYTVDLDRFEQKSQESFELKPREYYLDDLLNPDPNSAVMKEQPGRLRSELHERLSSPLYPLAFALLAVAVVGQAQSTRQSRGVRMGVCFATGVGLRLAGLASNNLVTLSASAVPLLYGVPILTSVVALIMILKGTRMTGGASRFERIIDAAGAAAARLKRAPKERPL